MSLLEAVCCNEEDEGKKLLEKKEYEKEINSRHECRCMTNEFTPEIVETLQPVECQSHQSREALQEAIVRESLYHELATNPFFKTVE
jgi:hypothetical protein